MLDREVTDAAARLADGEMAARRTGLAQALLSTQSDLARRGMMSSGNAVYAYADVGKGELRQIAVSLWSALKRSLEAMPPQVGPDLRSDVERAFGALFDERYQRVMTVLAPRFVSARPAAVAQGPPLVRPTFEALLQQYSAEITLWAAAQLRTSAPVTGAPAPSYTFNAPVGSVQTGPNATAHVIQNLGTTDAAALLTAVREFVRELPAMNLQPQSESEGLRLSAAIEQELQQPQPGGPMLRGLFNGLATFIQTIGAVPSAYAVLESMAISMHLM